MEKLSAVAASMTNGASGYLQRAPSPSGLADVLVFFGVLFTQWVRSSMREARREYRRLDRLEAQAARQDPSR